MYGVKRGIKEYMELMVINGVKDLAHLMLSTVYALPHEYDYVCAIVDDKNALQLILSLADICNIKCIDYDTLDTDNDYYITINRQMELICEPIVAFGNGLFIHNENAIIFTPECDEDILLVNDLQCNKLYFYECVRP